MLEKYMALKFQNDWENPFWNICCTKRKWKNVIVSARQRAHTGEIEQKKTAKKAKNDKAIGR